MIDRIGFFHFVQNHGEPIKELTKAISRREDVSGSLIVLPEAFNNGKGYYTPPLNEPKFDCDQILEQLSGCANEHGVTFVAGLLDPPNNSAYLIRAGRSPTLICRKRSESRRFPINCAALDDPDEHNPTEHEGISVAVLLCGDVNFSNIDVTRYRQQVAERVDSSQCAYKLVCIPAWMGADSFPSKTVALASLEGKYVVLANANPEGCGSFIANAKGDKVPFPSERGDAIGNPNYCERRNTIVLRTWAEVIAVSSGALEP